MGGLLTAGAAGSAGSQANAGYQNAQNQVSSTYNANAPNYNQFINSGQAANKQLSADTGLNGALGRQFTATDFHNSPGYQFDLSQGQQAIANSNSVRGGALSGGAQKAMSNYTQNQANNGYQQAYQNFTNNQNQNFSQLSSMSGQGLAATQGLGQLGSQYGQNMANLAVGQGNNAASTTMAQANGLGSALNMGLGIAGANGAFSGLFGGAGSSLISGGAGESGLADILGSVIPETTMASLPEDAAAVAPLLLM